jgi:hypothetical protein
MIKRNPEAQLIALCDVLPAEQVNTSHFGYRTTRFCPIC